jgi:serine/threonine-protein kinase
VTDGQPHEKSTSSEREAPLTLEDSDGSTQPVPADESRSSSKAASSPVPTPGGSQTEGGGTTGGFETLLGKLVVQSGLATKDEVDHCSNVLEETSSSSGSGSIRTLAELLVEKDFITQHQLARLRQEFEAKKSGQHIPGFKVIKKLGSGAMATVFLAKQLSLDRLVAIKILPKKFSGNVKFIERFYKEGRSAAQLNHPNIVGAYDVGRAGENHYFVMEYVDGPTVHDRIQKSRRVKEKDAIEIVVQVAKALEHAHQRGFVHRDIKAKNIMITKRGRVKLADLGLARAMSDQDAAKAEAGRAYGTPYYISPEQIRGELTIGPPADLYGLGATFFHMVTGRVPFEGKNPSAVMHKHLKAPLEPPDHINPEISAGCAQVIEMMMAKKVEDRYQNATDLLEDLELVASGEPPHFAHRTLDSAAITETLTDVASAPTVPVLPSVAPASVPLTQNTPVVVLMAVAAISVLLNLILLVVVLTS